MNHTKEPWVVASHNASVVACFSGKESASGATPFAALGGALNEEREANARRIVACVNACAGITTEELESIPSTGGMLGPRADVARIAQQRDELLSALKLWSVYARCYRDAPSTVTHGMWDDACRATQRAIATTTGEKA